MAYQEKTPLEDSVTAYLCASSRVVECQRRQLVRIMPHNVTGRRPELLLNATTCLVRPNIQCQSTTKKCTFRFSSLQLIMAVKNVKLIFRS